MPPRIGYLLPTREQVMEGRPEAAPLLALAERAEDLGFDSIWVGDSILARPRHEPLTLLSAVAARTRHAELGTAVLLPALRNPVVLAHGIATLDQISEGRFILGVGIASDVPNIRAEFLACGGPFEKRVKDAKSDVERAHAQSDLNVSTTLFQLTNASVLALPLEDALVRSPSMSTCPLAWTLVAVTLTSALVSGPLLVVRRVAVTLTGTLTTALDFERTNELLVASNLGGQRPAKKAAPSGLPNPEAES